MGVARWIGVSVNRWPGVTRLSPCPGSRWFTTLNLVALAMTFVVVLAGAYVRLSDAGLGCPDWPGCYGKAVVDDSISERAMQRFGQVADPVKAIQEMSHRYLAGLLGLLIFLMAAIAVRHRRHIGQALWLPLGLLMLVVVQAAFGMWTVTLQLQPLIVTTHLLLGMTLLWLLWYQWLSYRHVSLVAIRHSNLSYWIIAALVALFLQIALGGWTSANYAALACTDFPRCQGAWWPAMDFRHGFTLWHGNYPGSFEGGIGDLPSRTAIQVTHRIGALAVASLLLFVGLKARRVADRCVAFLGALLLGLLAAQILLGVANVMLGLPLASAIAHTGVAALLLLVLGSLLFYSRRLP